ncbi:conserved exported hypothetical protein [Frankia sp. AiPs1]|uniref:hypothetical protein n=1 Tax=Frankia sp. AiPa1 TaxID=573492 RepID=UPI00202ADD00|nr:hypothetical protein [Frankia sp. AiPa1]MCL9759123.1 hypothetical protein [Frankia sp. AiPa1]
MRSLYALLLAALVVTVSVLAGLVNAVLHRADGASLPTAARAGGRAALTVAAVLIAAAGLATL